MNLFFILIVMYTYVTTYRIVYFKYVEFTVGQLYLNKFP